MTAYKVALDVYAGPLDLMLFLIRREEIDIYDIPISRITSQYIEYIELLRELDPDATSEFLVLAATLMEIKSRTLLPSPPPQEGDDEIIDPRLELVRQLLEYKKFKDAAQYLDDAADVRSQQHPRSPVAPPRPPDEKALENLDIWDLFDAFNRLLEQTGRREAVHTVGVDETPLTLHADDILDSIDRAGGAQTFNEIFAGRTRAEMIGLFLALLELIRQSRIRVSQEKPFAAIWIHLLDKRSLELIGDNHLEGREAPRAQNAPAIEAEVDQSVEEEPSVEETAGEAEPLGAPPPPEVGEPMITSAQAETEINDGIVDSPMSKRHGPRIDSTTEPQDVDDFAAGAHPVQPDPDGLHASESDPDEPAPSEPSPTANDNPISPEAEDETQ